MGGDDLIIIVHAHIHVIYFKDQALVALMYVTLICMLYSSFFIVVIIVPNVFLFLATPSYTLLLTQARRRRFIVVFLFVCLCVCYRLISTTARSFYILSLSEE